MRNIAVILAGGTGSRLNADMPKQFLKVAGKAVIEHTIDVFQRHPLVDEIAVVASVAYHRKIEEYAIKDRFTKLEKVLAGGAERHLSSLSAIRAYEGEGECNLIFHDAVRPLLSPQTVTDVVEALGEYEAVDVAIPSPDTVIQVDSRNIITDIPSRRVLRRGQTPQGFRLSTIKEAYAKALLDPEFATTDDCGVIHKYLPEKRIFVVEGEEANMKLTYKEDFFLIEKLFQLKAYSFREKTLTPDERENLQGKVVVIFGASSGIGKDLYGICRACGASVYGYSRHLNNVDIRNVRDIDGAFKNAFRNEGRINYVIDTASVLYKEPLSHMSYGRIEESIGINYGGMVNVAKEAFPYLRETEGHLVFFTSSSYTRGRMDYSIYSSTKCATVNFVQALAEEWGMFGIRVNCVNPERTKTPMRVRNFGIEPEGTLLDSMEVATVTAKLLSSDATGQVIDVKIKDLGYIR